MSEYINLGFTIILAVFIFFGMFWGLIRGLKRTTGRLFFLLITSVVLIFITIPITKLLLNIPINITISNNGEIIDQGNIKISQIIADYVQIYLGEEFISKNPQFVSVITAIPIILVNAFVYLILFWLLKYLLLPFDYLLYKLIFDRRKKQTNMGFAAWDFGDDNTTPTPIPENNTPKKAPANESTQQPSTTPETTVSQPETQLEPTQEKPTELQSEQKPENVESIENEPVASNIVETPEANTPSTPEPTTKTTAPAGEVGMFIKKDDQIASANAHGNANMPSYAEAHSEQPNKKEKLKKQKVRKESTKKASEPIQTKEHVSNSKEKYVRPKKHRLLGALVGGVVGLVITINTMIPVYGLLNMLDTNKDAEVNNITNSTYSLDSASNGMATEILKGYETSLMHTLGNSTGLEKLYLTGFDQLTSTTINGKKIVLREDVENLVGTVVQMDKTLGLYKEISNNGIENITQAQLDELIDSVEDLVAQSKKVQILNCLADYILPASTNYISSHQIRMSQDDTINDLMLDTINELTHVVNVDMFEEAEGLLDIVNYINDQHLLIHIITNKYENPVSIIQSLDNDFSTQLVNKITSLKLVNSTMSNVFRIGMTAADNAVHFGYVQDDEEQEDFVDSVKNIINDAFTTARTISEESPIYLTQNTLAPLGTLLDRIKDCGIINTETYNNVVAFASRKLKQITANFVPGNLIDYVNNSLVTNLNNVTSWTAEMTKIDNALNILRDKDKGILGTVEQGHDLRTGYSIHISMSETTLNNIGTFLDVLETSELFGGTANIYDSTNTTYASTSITRLFANILDYVHDQIVSNTNSNLTDMLSIISDMQDNIIRCGHRITDNNFWNTEISKVSPLISSLYSILDDSNSSGRFELSNTLGIDLDKAKHSALLGGNTTLKIVDVAMDRVKNMILGENYSDSGENNLNDKINGLFVDIKANLEDPDTETLMQDDNDFWSKEIVCFKSLQKLSEDSNSISDISSCLILAQDIDLAYTSQLIPDTSLDSIIVSVIRNTKTKDATKTIDVKINELIEDIASDIESPTFFYSTTNPDGYSRENFWTIELNHINNLKSLDLDNSTSGNLANNIRNIGTELDKVVYGYTDGDDTIRGSYLITEIRVRNILSTAITAMKNNIVGSFDNSMATIIGSAVDSINKNIYDTTNSNPICVSISSFGYELGNIATLTDLEISGSIFSVPTGTEEERSAHTAAINAQLASIGNTIDSIAFNTIGENGCIIYDDDKNNSRIVTRAILNTLIKDTFGLALNSETDNTYQSVFNSLITAIQTNIANVGNKVFSWKKELAFVTTLTDMNQDKEYSLANAGDNIAVNIDAIAFNVYTKNNNIGYNDLEYYQYDTDKLLGGYDTVNQNNSLFITREILKVAVAGLVADFKYNSATPGSKEEITNDLIDNISNTINTEDYNTDGSKYNNYATLFTALNTEKQAITDSFESFTQNNNVIDNDTAENIDLFLHARQNVLICGVVITRKMANLILTNVHDKIEESITAYPGMNSSDVENTQTMQYINTLRTHYTGSNANSTTPENYNTPGTYNNPFRTVYATYETDRNNNFGMTP